MSNEKINEQNEMTVEYAAGLFTAALANVIMNGEDAWKGDKPVFSAFGWNGIATPVNRAAFVKKFGEVATAQIESAVRCVMANGNPLASAKASGKEVA